MKKYAVNRPILRTSWIYLLCWLAALSALITLRAMGSPYWFYPVPGAVFLILWLMLAGLYPKVVMLNEKGVAVTMIGLHKARLITFPNLQVKDREDHFELNNAGAEIGRKYLIAKKSLPGELADFFQQQLDKK